MTDPHSVLHYEYPTESESMMKYMMSERRNGVRAVNDTEVSEEFVENFTSKTTREFFEGLGGTEFLSAGKGGVIYMKSISPSRETMREVVFTPIPEGGA